MPRRRSPKESSIVRSILDDLRSRGRAVWFRKNHGGPFGAAGVPDIEVVFSIPLRVDASGIAFQAAENVYAAKYANESDPGGEWRATIANKIREDLASRREIIVAFLEVKKPGEKPTALQDSTMAAIRYAGAHVRVVHSKAEAIEFLETLGIPEKKQ